MSRGAKRKLSILPFCQNEGRDFDFGKEHKKRKNINYLQKRLDIASKM